jgi:gliding motility-associated-like protein
MRNLLFSAALVLLSLSSRASHIVGADLTYKWTGGLTYTISVVLYGDCGPSSAGAFSTLPTSQPHVCVFDAATNVGQVVCTIDSFKEVTPVCPRDSASTMCHSYSFTTPGVKAFYYHGTYTLPYYSRTWRFVYNSDNNPGSGAGRAAAITNITPSSLMSMQLIDTLDNYALVNSRQHNSSPVLTVLPTPYFCANTTSCYNPGAVDLYDVNPIGEPSGDSLQFALIAATQGNSTCVSVGGPVTYMGTAWSPPTTPVSAATPLTVTAGTFSFDGNTGQLCFYATIAQRDVVVYNIDEYRNDTLGRIDTIAGNGSPSFSGDGGAALTAGIHGPTGICIDPSGNIYFSDSANNRIRMIDGSGLITTIAGNGVAGYCGDGGIAAASELNGPMGIAYDAAVSGGALVFADYGNNAIRMISPASAAGIISTVAGSNIGVGGFKGDGFNALGYINTMAGTGAAGYTGDGAAATLATMRRPKGFVMDLPGNIYFSDAGNNVVRKITPLGTMSTIAGTGVAGYCGDGGAAVAAELNGPAGLAINLVSLYIADSGNNVIREVNLTTGLISTIAGNVGGFRGYQGDGNAAVGGVLTTITGTGTNGYTGDGTAATGADIHNPSGVCKSAITGNIYFADHDNNSIRMITPAGVISTIAGSATGVAGYSGDGGAATLARLNGPMGIDVDNFGNIYFADNGNNVVRKIASTGTITTIAGTGVAGFNGDGASPATKQLNNPTGIAVIPSGAGVYVSDMSNQRVRLITPGVTGNINTIAGNGTGGYTIDGIPAVASEIYNPEGLAYSATGDGYIYIADALNNRIRQVDLTTGIINTVVGTGTAGFSPDGTAAASALISNPTGVAVDALGNIYIGDDGNNVIREVTACQKIYTIAGNTTGAPGYGGDGLDPIATTARFNTGLSFLCVDVTGNVLVSDPGNSRIRKVAPTELNNPTAVAVTAGNDTLYIADGGNNSIRMLDLTTGIIYAYAGNGTAGYAGDGGLITTAKFNYPAGLYLNTTTHSLYIADANNNRVRKINIAAGTIANFAGTGTPVYSGDGTATAENLWYPTGVTGDALGNIYIADNTDALIRRVDLCGNMITIAGLGIAGSTGDGGVPTSAKVNAPNSVYVDANFNIYITDYGNNKIREIHPTELNHPTGIAVDGPGNIYFSDNGNQRIRKIATTGVISTIAGTGVAGTSVDPGTATSALVNNPWGLFWDNTTNFLYIADAGNNKIRYINTTTGTMNAFAGSTAGFSGDGRVATTAQLNSPRDMYKDVNGNMLITDRGNNAIREVTTAGYIYTLAGTTVAGESGDGGDPVLADLNKPMFLVTDPSHNVYITDNANNRLRIILADALVKPAMVGSMQREMTFLILTTCTTQAPIGDHVDSVGTGPGTLNGDSTQYVVCGNTGIMDLYFDGSEPGDTSDITITATGLPPGSSFNVTANNTPFPHGIFNINTATATPGTYTFYVSYQDNRCPLVGSKTSAITITILPVPTIRDSLVTNATCATEAVVKIFPGGTGKPWTIKVSKDMGSTGIVDTFQVFTNDSLAFLDNVAPGNDSVTIFTSLGGQCSKSIPLIVPVPTFSITASSTNPTYCGAKDGTIVLYGLTVGNPDTAVFTAAGVLQPEQPFIVSSVGTDTIKNLLAGSYTGIYAIEGYCHTNNLLENLVNPPFVFRTVTRTNPTKCGFCDGVDTLFGLHPGQLDTISYQLAAPVGSPRYQTSYFITSDSMVVISGLCSGSYKDIVVNTAGVCIDSLSPPSLDTPTIKAAFDTAFHFGCRADTVQFTNLSVPASDLTYLWVFGDGATSFATSPQHVYDYTIANTETAVLYITNTKCNDSAKATFTLNNFVHSNFTYAPDQYVCQGVPVTFTNLSTGADPYSGAPPTYLWSFGDNNTTPVTNPTHTYNNTGKYAITLVAVTDIPCYDTSVQYISVDSNSVISISATDSVLCQGQEINFTGIFSNIGDTLYSWAFGDGNTIVNVNPVLHSYENVQTPFTVTLDVKYRSCPEKTITRTVNVFANPSIYLGPDLSMCPGSNALTLVDEQNESNPKASWLWNTGETSPSINVVKPGTYSAVVTINGCSASDTVLVQKDCYMDIPNVFSPNNDGTNDFFFPRQMLTKGVATFKMNIYNRWGQLVYETTSTDGRGWDGSLNGTPQPEGVYVYMIDATYKDGQIEHHQGNVTLLR